ncbi:MAG: zinc-binding dehydrogenase, partial [Myxococcota bacterium]
GVDHVVEVGGVGTLGQSLRAVRSNGCVSLIGVLSGNTSDVSLLPALMNNIRIQGIFVGHRESFEAMNRCISAHRIEPVVSMSFGADDVASAFRAMESGKHFGKIAVTVS